MILDLTCEQEAIVRELARNEGKSPAELLVETALRLEDDEAERRVIDERLREADEGAEWLSHQEVGERLRKLLQHG